jgi:hypothetical protein
MPLLSSFSWATPSEQLVSFLPLLTKHTLKEAKSSFQMQTSIKRWGTAHRHVLSWCCQLIPMDHTRGISPCAQFFVTFFTMSPSRLLQL